VYRCFKLKKNVSNLLITLIYNKKYINLTYKLVKN